MNNGLVAIYIALYFWVISIKWEGIEIFASVLTAVCVLSITFLVPESPKFYLSNKRFAEARISLTFISKFNGKVEAFTGRFERERLDQHAKGDFSPVSNSKLNNTDIASH